MKHLLPFFFCLLFLSNISTAQINKAGSRASLKVYEVENIKLNDLSQSLSGKVTFSVIYSDDVLQRQTGKNANELNVNFDDEILIVLYNGTGNGKVNPTGATYMLKNKYLKIGYSLLEKQAFQPYTIIRIKKLEFKRLDVLPYKKYVKSKEWME